MANYLIMPYAKNNQDPTPGSPTPGPGMGLSLLLNLPTKQGGLRLSFPCQAKETVTGSNPRRKDPCRSQSGFASDCASATPASLALQDICVTKWK
ncbi:hypothetical protein PoB_000229600 [Plakobranchus ocellatus]|uniref:Uncharacterized protein n=1 Tax=Plakobranchus ocellatus TaxID=259542 RepID=A0AAV3Y0E5_9GAST|nr:hypothetical protein PoB_000229600 [Plakobranchus ocellatus]